ncbi:hypothetical protein [Longimicrobium sp.]|uniref:hypothetical protein n=1 Tax=Longimicrobium sp. TaxID=2029185 RepID=UPI002CA7A03C|nr:hypothetical protein [Longimicrobium sp.]HSU14640.1 hypothetical protein [Longimicrobium sp.]
MIMDAVSAKVQQLRERWEREGYEVVERPDPEDFPFDTGYFGRYRPAMLARRGAENHVFEVRDGRRLPADRLIQRSDEIRKHPGWHFYLISTEDVVPHDAPGMQGDPPSWASLARSVDAAMRLADEVSPSIALLGLWSTLEGLLRRIAVDNAIPVDLLPAASLIPILHDQGLVPREAYEPLKMALEVHRRVLHGYEATATELTEAVKIVAAVLCELLPKPAERAA